MFANNLCLNYSTTEFIVFELNRHTKDMPTCINQIGDERIKPVKVVKNLGVLLDMQLYMRLYISTRSESVPISYTENVKSGLPDSIHNRNRIRETCT